MQIALFHNLPSGGAKRAVYEWTKRLCKEHIIDVYTLSSADHAFCDIRPFVRKHHVYEFKTRRLFNSPWGRLNQYQRWRDLGDLTDLSRRIATQIDRSRYDVVFAHTCRYSFIPVLLQFLETPSVYYLHEPFGKPFFRDIERPYIRTDKRRELINRFDPLIDLYEQRLESVQQQSVRITSRMLANSIFTKTRMKAAFGIEAPVSYYGVDIEGFSPSRAGASNNHVLSVGELSPRKGFDFLIESLAYVPTSQRPALRLASNRIDPQEYGYLQNLAKARGVQLQVKSNLDVKQLQEEYSAAKFCVYAPVLEPFGLVPLESMACGVPVIGVREGGVLESIVHEQTGLLVERNPQRFAEAIQYLLSKPDLVMEYGHNSREYVLRNWTWDQSVASLERNLTACANMG